MPFTLPSANRNESTYTFSSEQWHFTASICRKLVAACNIRRLVLFFTDATLPSAGISCHRVSVAPSVCPGSLVFLCQKSQQNSNGVIPNGGAKCRCSSCELATIDAKHCQLSSVASLSDWASTLFFRNTFAVMQRVTRGLSSSVDPCLLLTVAQLWFTCLPSCAYLAIFGR